MALLTHIRRKHNQGGDEPETPTPLLDLVTGASGAWSVRLLRTAYTGNCMRVRESGGDTEADIGFSDGWLDEAALLSHCGSNDGYVVKWYDQSGSGHDVSQSVDSRQFLIVSGGVVQKENNKPALIGLDSALRCFDTNEGTAFSTSPSAISIVAVVGACADTGYHGIFSPGSSSLSVMLLSELTDGKWGTYSAGNRSANSAISAQSVVEMYSANANAGSFYKNGSSDGSFLQTEGQPFHVGGAASLSQTHDGPLQELIYWESDESSNHSTISSNINSAFAIFS